MSAFERTLNWHLLSYRIVLVRLFCVPRELRAGAPATSLPLVSYATGLQMVQVDVIVCFTYLARTVLSIAWHPSVRQSQPFCCCGCTSRSQLCTCNHGSQAPAFSVFSSCKTSRTFTRITVDEPISMKLFIYS